MSKTLNSKGVEAGIDAVFQYADGDARQIAEAVITAYLGAVPESPSDHVVGSVKPLEWTKAALWHSYGLVIRIGQTPFGAYHILKGSQGRFEVYFTTVPLSGAIDSEAEALAWAQFDYERRIRAALASAEVEG